MSSLKLTDKEAYLAMYSFLEEYYQLTKSDDLGSLLGSMSLLEDGGTADPTIESKWLETVKKSIKGDVNAGLALCK